jgi:hypothetical protein
VRTAIDTNILSSLWSGEESADSVRKLLNAAAERGGLVICPLVYAELRGAPRATVSFVDHFLERTGIVVDWNLDKEIWQLASERYEKYAIRKRKQRMGEPKRFLTDFIVGAHAMLRADVLITLDQRPYRRDFTELLLNP